MRFRISDAASLIDAMPTRRPPGCIHTQSSVYASRIMASRFTGLSSIKIASKLFRINSVTVMFPPIFPVSLLPCVPLIPPEPYRHRRTVQPPRYSLHRPKQEGPLPLRVQFPSCHPLPGRSFSSSVPAIPLLAISLSIRKETQDGLYET